MTTRSLRATFVVSVAALLMFGAAAPADTIVVPDKPHYKGKILNLTQNGFQMRWEMTGSNRSFSLTQIERIEVDASDDLNEAERLRVAGDFKKAISSYERAYLRAPKAWMKDYINARLVMCCGQTNQFARAVKTYVQLCQSDSVLLPWIELPQVMPKGSPDNDAALRAIEGALAMSPDAPYANKLKELRLSIRLVQGDPATVLAEIESQLESPNPEHQARMRLKHIELLMAVGKLDEARKSLDIAKEGSGEQFKALDAQYEPDLLFFEGQLRHARKDHVHAALGFMRVAITFPRRKALAAESLYWAAKSMLDSEAVPMNEVVVPLQEAIERFAGTEGAAKAQKMLNELQTGS